MPGCRISCFNPKREAHPLQTVPAWKWKPEREKFQSQTGSPSSSDGQLVGIVLEAANDVSIPNGKPILFRRQVWRFRPRELCVSIPNGKPILFRPQKKSARRCLTLPFQSQTGSPSSSDVFVKASRLPAPIGFNPKREAHPLQTGGAGPLPFHSPQVSIPNGKPILFRPSIAWKRAE